MGSREGYRWPPRAWAPSPHLEAIIGAVAGGQTTAEIAASLGISADGVKWHIGQALLETGLSDRRELATWWEESRRSAAQQTQATSAKLNSSAITWISDVEIS